MHVLFDMQSPTFLRLFDGTIEELARRGHRVTLGLWNADALERPSAEVLAAGERLRVVRARPRRRDRWAALATLVRETLDYVRYLDARLEATYLRERRDLLRGPLRLLRGVDRLAPRSTRRLLRAGLALEAAIPSAPTVERMLQEHRPDVVISTPFVVRPDQTEVVKSARALGVPSAVGVASWDHLTTKGLIRARPDRVLVWNEAQAREAVDLHLVSPESVVVTGAHAFDRWFDQEVATSREEFCARAGLDQDRPFALFVGSSRMISPAAAEHAFLARWIEAVRSSPDPEVAALSILVRPHPDNRQQWSELDVRALENVALWRPAAEYAISDDAARREFFDSLHHSAVVVGINTSAMIEAAIVGRPVLTVKAEDFADTQAATLHFRYLLPENGGFVVAAATLDEHVRQLAAVLAHPEGTAAAREHFLRSFVRPRGPETPAGVHMADAIEATAALDRRPSAGGLGQGALRLALRPFALLLDRPPGRLVRGWVRPVRRAGRRGRRRGRRAGRRAVRGVLRRGRRLAARATR